MGLKKGTVFADHEGTINCVATGEGVVVIGSHDQHMSVWDIASGKQRYDKVKLDNAVQAVAIINKDTIIAGDDSGNIVYFELATGKQIKKIDKMFGVGILDFDITADGKKLCYSAAGKEIGIVDLDAAAVVWEKDLGEGDEDADNANVVRFTKDGSQFARADRNGDVTFWDANATEAPASPIRTLQAKNPSGSSFNALSVLEFSPDGKMFTVGGVSGFAFVFATDAESGAAPLKLLDAKLVGSKGERFPDEMFCSGFWAPDSKGVYMVHHHSTMSGSGPDIFRKWVIDEDPTKDSGLINLEKLTGSDKMFKVLPADANNSAVFVACSPGKAPNNYGVYHAELDDKPSSGCCLM